MLKLIAVTSLGKWEERLTLFIIFAIIQELEKKSELIQELQQKVAKQSELAQKVERLEKEVLTLKKSPQLIENPSNLSLFSPLEKLRKSRNGLKYVVIGACVVSSVILFPFLSLNDISNLFPTIDVNNKPDKTTDTRKPKYDLVSLDEIAPSILQDMRYATSNNFMNERLYPEQTRCFLRQSLAQKLRIVQSELEKKSIGLEVLDCFRPIGIQRKMWKKFPNSNYVANPATASQHNYGIAVDLTLTDIIKNETGKTVKVRNRKMPSDFDDFSVKSHMNYSGVSEEAKSNRELLKATMEKYGFKSIKTEWWHYEMPELKKGSPPEVSFDDIRE